MPVFLTDAWVDALAATAASIEVDPQATLAVRQVVDDVSWTVRLQDGCVRVDRHPEADVILTTDRRTAAALVRGELSAQDAFASGLLQLQGDVLTLLAVGGGLAGLEAAYAGVRASTTF